MIAASKAVDCLSKSSLTELKNFKAPPSGTSCSCGTSSAAMRVRRRMLTRWQVWTW